MNGVEVRVIKTGVRMCKSFTSCLDCPIRSYPCPIAVIRDCEDKQEWVPSNGIFDINEGMVRAIKEWDLDNPILFRNLC